VQGRGGGGGKGEGGGQGGEMTQTLYAHMNKIKIKKKKITLGIKKNLIIYGEHFPIQHLSLFYEIIIVHLLRAAFADLFPFSPSIPSFENFPLTLYFPPL
jgi:hypothetical protein